MEISFPLYKNFQLLYYMTNITIEIQNEINQDVVNECKNSLLARNRWCFLTHFFDIGSHLLSGACVIIAFISGGTKISSLALLAGALGTTSQVFFQFSLYCFKQYQLQSSLIEKLSQKEKVEDDLINEEQPVPVNTPTNN